MESVTLRALLKVSQVLRQHVEDERFWGLLLAELDDLFARAVVSIALYDPTLDQLTPPDVLYMDAPLTQMPEALARAVLRHNIALQFADVWAERERLASLAVPFNDALETVGAWVGVPLRNRYQQPLGVLALQAAPHNLTNENFLLLELVAEQLALALETRAALNNAQRQQHMAHSLIEVARAASMAFELEPFLELLLTQLKRLITYARVTVALMEGEELVVRACHGVLPDTSGTRLQAPVQSPLGQVLTTKQPVLVASTADHPDWEAQPAALRSGNPQAWLGVPIATQQTLLGAILLDAQQPNAYSTLDMTTLFAFSRQVAVTLQNIQLYQEEHSALERVQRQGQRLASLNRISTLMNASLNAREVLERAVAQLQETFGVAYVNVVQLVQTPDGEELRVTAECPRDRLLGIRVLQSNTPIFVQTLELLRQPQPRFFFADERDAILDDETTLARVQQLFPTRGTLVVPLLAQQRPLGALCLAYDAPPNDEDMSALTTAATQLAVAIRNAELYEEAVNANRLKSQFLANMSHEFRTPLNTILGYTELLLSQTFGELNDKQISRLERIEKSGKHLLDIMNNVLDIAQIEAGRMSLELATLDPRPLLERLAEQFQKRAAAKSLTLTYDLRDTATVVGDVARLQQLFTHLLENAIKFTERGDIQLSMRLLTLVKGRSRVDGVRLPAHVHLRDGDWLMVTVRDTGIGISLEHQMAIFNPFQQADNAINREYEGTGLGLTLSERLAKLHGGTLFVESQLGVGSAFHVLLPAYLDRRITEQAAASHVPRHPALILFDEDATTRQQLGMWSKGLYELYIADTLETMLRLVDEHAPCVLVLDIAMKQHDLWKVIKEIKERKVGYCAVVIASAEDERTKAYYLGVDDYLLKPLEEDGFRASVARYLPFSS